MNSPTRQRTASRRRFIRLLGGGMVLAAAGATTGCSTALPDEAVRPWLNPDAESDPRRFMLAHALLAHPELRRSASMRFVWSRLEVALRARLKSAGAAQSIPNI